MTIKSSQYVNSERRNYALYVMTSRAIPAVTDGLKTGGRRVIWTARNGQKWKSANLAGATMPLHPHAMPEGAINTLTAPYGNNVPLFDGYGAFGTLLEPTAYGASRYTSVKISKFTEDVMLRDIEIVPMVDNYDGTEIEPVHFLPLVPVVLINPTEGIAVGFATNILPRDLGEIIEYQIRVLQNKSTTALPLTPVFAPLNNPSIECTGGTSHLFKGEYKHINATTVEITKIPYGQTHAKVLQKIEAECEKGNVNEWDDNSRDTVSIVVNFKKGYLSSLEDPNLIYSSLGLTIRHTENLNVIGFSGDSIWNTDVYDLTTAFTNWRLGFYVQRYERLRDLLLADIRRYLDIRIAITKNVGGVAKKTQSRAELKEYLALINIINVDYIADLPVYRFTEAEYNKNEERLKEAEIKLAEYNELLSSEELRKGVYILELKEVLNKYKKGLYSAR